MHFIHLVRAERLAHRMHAIPVRLRTKPRFRLQSGCLLHPCYSTGVAADPTEDHVETATAEAGEGESGHIEARHNEGILFFDSEYLIISKRCSRMY